MFGGWFLLSLERLLLLFLHYEELLKTLAERKMQIESRRKLMIAILLAHIMNLK